MRIPLDSIPILIPFRFIRPSEKKLWVGGNRRVEQEFYTKAWKQKLEKFYQQLGEDEMYTFLQIRWDEARQGWEAGDKLKFYAQNT